MYTHCRNYMPKNGHAQNGTGDSNFFFCFSPIFSSLHLLILFSFLLPFVRSLNWRCYFPLFVLLFLFFLFFLRLYSSLSLCLSFSLFLLCRSSSSYFPLRFVLFHYPSIFIFIPFLFRQIHISRRIIPREGRTKAFLKVDVTFVPLLSFNQLRESGRDAR